MNFWKNKVEKLSDISNLDDLTKVIETQKQELTKLEKKINLIISCQNFFLQKFGFVRFNPFNEVAGEQSFSIALLDGEQNGFVITSLHTRGGTRTYAKEIKKGEYNYGLSNEEQKAVKLASNNEEVQKY